MTACGPKFEKAHGQPFEPPYIVPLAAGNTHFDFALERIPLIQGPNLRSLSPPGTPQPEQTYRPVTMDFDKLDYVDRKIIVGIDFGTTYSGVAWAETKRPDRRVAITTWPISKTAREGESSDKVPTKLRYTSEGVQWGFQIPSNAPPTEVLEWFKLYVDLVVPTIR